MTPPGNNHFQAIRKAVDANTLRFQKIEPEEENIPVLTAPRPPRNRIVTMVAVTARVWLRSSASNGSESRRSRASIGIHWLTFSVSIAMKCRGAAQ